MLRKTLTILSLIGLLLSVGLWGVSYFGFEYVKRKPSQSEVEGVRIALVFGMISWTDADRWRLVTGSFVLLGEVGLHMIGLTRLETVWTPSVVTTSTGSVASINIPLWIPTVLFGLTVWLCHPLQLLRHLKRKRLGLCLQCGYDLRGSKDVCPECGTEFKR